MANMLTANEFNVIDFRHLCPLAACDTEKTTVTRDTIL